MPSNRPTLSFRPLKRRSSQCLPHKGVHVFPQQRTRVFPYPRLLVLEMVME